MSGKNKETKDLCGFCADFWGEDKHKSCHTPCACAAYANQDWVGQQERLIGLPVDRPWNQTLVPKGSPNFWAGLSEDARKRVTSRLPALISRTGPVLGSLLGLLISGHTKEEICETLNITPKTFDKYAERLRNVSREC